MLLMDGQQPPKIADVVLGGLRVCMPLKALLFSGDDALPQHQSVLRAMHTLNSLKNYIRMLRGLLPIHSNHWSRAKGLMWGTRGPYLPAVLVDDGSWRLMSHQPTVGIVKKGHGSIFLFLRRSHIFLTSDPAAK
jgi:hypothetical protein